MNNTPTCILDREIINDETVSQMDDLGLSVFAKLCGVNRGAFGELYLFYVFTIASMKDFYTCSV